MNRTKSVLVAAGVSLALAFTFSCSDDGGGGNTIKKARITGVFQKGPFVQGTLATLNELDYNLNPTGRPYQTLITDNKGTFELRNVELVSPYAHLIANGFYRNEVTGEISNAAITLQAITDITDKDNINVNIITHLEYYRVLDLVDGGMTVKAAKRQVQNEIFAQFGINSDKFNFSEDMSIFGTTEGDAALLAISILLQSNLGEGEFSQRLINFSQAIRNGGAWNDEAAKNAIADWASGVNLAAIRSNILGWGLAYDVPAFEKYIRNYWSANYDFGECNAALSGVMKKSNRAGYYTCNGDYWQSTSPTLICTGLSGKGYNGIAIQEPILSCSVGEISGASWTNAPDWDNPVKGTYSVGAKATCGVAPVTTNCGYLNVIEQPTLFCRMLNSSVERVAMSRPILSCSDGSIPFADVLKGTLPNWNSPDYGAYSVNAEANCGVGVLDVSCGTLTIVCSATSNTDTHYCSDGVIKEYGSVTDNGGQTYKTVVIGTQTWMAENLNNAVSGSKCGNGTSLSDANTATCDTYGRLYNWETAKTVCPSGWHLPSDEEWTTLTDYAGGDSIAGSKLKATSGWNTIGDKGNGTDEFGFSALAGGAGYSEVVDYSGFGGVGDQVLPLATATM